MKRKVLLSFFIIFIILALVGCWTLPDCPQWSRAQKEVHSYWEAIINRQYELAKYYCIYDGIWYNKVDEWEEYININSQGEASIIISESQFYKPTEVIGNTAIVYVTIYANKIAFPGSSLWEVDTFEYEIELIEETSPPGDWKLK